MVLELAHKHGIGDAERVGEIARIVRDSFVRELEPGEAEKRVAELLEIKKPLQAEFLDDLAQIVSQVKEIGEEEFNKMFEARPLQEALQQKPQLGEVEVTDSRLFSSEGGHRISSTINNWIEDYIHELGAGSHSSLERSKYAYESKNAKKLNEEERRNLLQILESYDTGASLYFNKETGEVAFDALGAGDFFEENRRGVWGRRLEKHSQKKPTPSAPVSSPPPPSPATTKPSTPTSKVASPPEEKERVVAIPKPSTAPTPTPSSSTSSPASPTSPPPTSSGGGSGLFAGLSSSKTSEGQEAQEKKIEQKGSSLEDKAGQSQESLSKASSQVDSKEVSDKDSKTEKDNKTEAKKEKDTPSSPPKASPPLSESSPESLAPTPASEGVFGGGGGANAVDLRGQHQELPSKQPPKINPHNVVRPVKFPDEKEEDKNLTANVVDLS
jgi:hypothetical protein